MGRDVDREAGERGVCCVVRCGVVWCGCGVDVGVVWCGVVRCDVVWCGVVWCGAVWCDMVWCGVVRCGVVWCVVWCVVCGIVWYRREVASYSTPRIPYQPTTHHLNHPALHIVVT